MSTNTASAAATNTAEVEATPDSQDQAKTDMNDCVKAIGVMGDIYNQASELASKLYAETDDAKRTKLIASCSRMLLSTTGDVVLTHLELKTDSNSEIGQRMPELARLSTLEQIEKIDRSIIADVARQLNRHLARTLDEQLGNYSSAGPVYAGIPLGVDFGIEVGIVTGEGTDLQRSGLVLGLRLDHATGAKPARRLGLSKAKG